MKRILIIGIGSRIMLDDAIGISIVEDLKNKNINPNVTYILGETDVNYCIGEILKYDSIIVIDAFLSGKPPGNITVFPINELSNEKEDSFYSMHGEHLLTVLGSTKYTLEGIFIGIEPFEINYGFSLSKELQNDYSCILRNVQQHINEYIERFGGYKMHDTFLLKRISDSLGELCNANRISKVHQLRIITSQDSHIHHDNLLEQITSEHKGIVGEWTEIIIERQDIEKLTAVIDSIEGDILE
jgi:hydrogenase maturation protease